MSLFRKKEVETKVPACACCGGSPSGSIKVLGSGCKSCHALYEAATEAVKSLGLDMEVEYITDMEKIMEYGIMSTPALIVNEEIVSAGKVLRMADVKKILSRLS